MSRVLVYGATGFTGGLVSRALMARGIEPVLGGRDRRRLEQAARELGDAIEVRPAPVHDADALTRAMRDIDVVISCAGPFAQVGEPVLATALASGADYLDSTGEQEFTRSMYERYESAARRAGATAVSGCAFEVALGDWAASLAAAQLGGQGAIDEIIVAYSLDHFRPSAGTRLSALDSVKRESVVWNFDRWEPIAPARERMTISFPDMGQRRAISFPSAEVITVPRHVEVHRVQTFLALEGAAPLGRLGARLAGVLAPVLPLLGPLLDGARARSSDARPPTDDERRAARFAIVARASRGFDDARVAVVGSDVYGTTGEILANAAATLLARRDGDGDRRPGVLAPSQAFDPEPSLAALADCGCTVVR